MVNLLTLVGEEAWLRTGQPLLDDSGKSAAIRGENTALKFSEKKQEERLCHGKLSAFLNRDREHDRSRGGKWEKAIKKVLSLKTDDEERLADKGANNKEREGPGGKKVGAK